MTEAEKDRVQLEVYSDVICPWCYVGQARLERALKLVKGDISLDINWKPFELNPVMPEGGMERRQYLINKFGSADISGMQQRLSEAGAADSLDFNFAAIKTVPRTFNAHRLLWFARNSGKQNDLARILFRNYFSDGGDIGDLEVLVKAASEAGLNAEEVRSFLLSEQGAAEIKIEERAGLDLDIHSVPTFVVGGKVVASGAMAPEHLAKLIDGAVNQVAR